MVRSGTDARDRKINANQGLRTQNPPKSVCVFETSYLERYWIFSQSVKSGTKALIRSFPDACRFYPRFLRFGAIWTAKQTKNLRIRNAGRVCEFFQSSWAAFFVFWVSETREGSPPGTSIRKLSKKCTRGQSSQYNTEKSYDKRVFEWGSVLEARSGDTGASGSTALVARALDIRRTVLSHISTVPTLKILG